jgi:hypothetical protein
MQYVLTIYEDESGYADMTQEQGAEVMAAYAAFGEKHAGVIKGGDALEPTATATSVRVRDGERLVTDGPFAETKEALGGFYVIDVANLDEAIAVAADIPGARTGTVEVRPVLDYAAYAGAEAAAAAEAQGAQA